MQVWQAKKYLSLHCGRVQRKVSNVRQENTLQEGVRKCRSCPDFTYLYSHGRIYRTQWDSHLHFLTCSFLGVVFFLSENFLEGCLEISERINVQLDFCRLASTIKGAQANASRLPVDDCLRNLNASFAVLGCDRERKIYDVGLLSSDCHVKGLSFSRCIAGLFVSSSGNSPTFYIYYTTKKCTLSTLFSIPNDFKHLEHFPLRADSPFSAREMPTRRKKAVLKRSMISSTQFNLLRAQTKAKHLHFPTCRILPTFPHMWAGCVEAVTYIRPHVGVLPTLAALCLPHHTIPTLCVAAYVALPWPACRSLSYVCRLIVVKLTC